MSYLDKIAEAMDYLEAYGIDPVGGMILLANTDANGNVLDEKIASVADYELDGAQSAALVEVAQYLGGVNDEIVKVAAEINAEAEFMKEAVASYAITSLEAGMDPMDAFILAGSAFLSLAMGFTGLPRNLAIWINSFSLLINGIPLQ